MTYFDLPFQADELTDEAIFAAHEGGKLAVTSARPLRSRHDLSLAYTPGVARVCTAIEEDPSLYPRYTGAGRTVAVISDGTAVLGLGNIGPQAAMPVMEGKCQLFASFVDVNAIPIVVNETDPDKLIAAIAAIASSFGAINLEDISAPRCFEVERRLDEMLDIPVFHDDQHGTAIVLTAGIKNACKLTGRNLSNLRIVISGAGAAGIACCKMLLEAGVKDIILLDSQGVIHPQREGGLIPVKAEIAEITNPRRVTDRSQAFDGADVFIGLSRGHVGENLLQRMAPKPFLFSLANPDPEIEPELAEQYASVVATGRSDLPNQINNVLAFPGIFQGALNAEARSITPAMKLAASEAIASIVGDELAADYIIPSALDTRVAPAVAAAVEKAALAEQHASQRNA
ncbi:NADP-dependent malic enzyme [Corynebacterium sp. 153RC1]|uniref:NAD(P)-dependent malic enzyme n=1 Tax=unclassified Corynebacterium TaxID=2624378 RepID=UPI00211B8B32|nr:MULTISPECIES: NADP-dependent malic enzyme [unclassified Corynebacterium]MCQ9371296.1 NADP-dependent malic enzyme [Corynebacterium sp. 35RC1]MCQ9351904.1 NADP-dependent malic enzyme [Corynebacterium sp. 209RC1]MCQ9353653.1 NADP-dependent malic enzyme [Corynebacterium sp. 1222RC1]MCQ9356363.1 NADP-dependent malic enzyme [Corynebacterium sp. 122RC1]MCQ9358465.1 NADP-dependent malic enzyme [Corynebacterium sp. 142RC1]